MTGSSRFNIGDRVMLTDRFCQSDNGEFSESDQKIAQALEEVFEGKTPRGRVAGLYGDRVNVIFDISVNKSSTYGDQGWRDDLITSPTILAHEAPSDEEVTEAIRSIMGQSPATPPAP